MKKWKSILLLVLTISLLFVAPVYADTAYQSFTIDQNGQPKLTQSAYLPVGVIDGYSIFGHDNSATQQGINNEAIQLSQPQDLFIDGQNHLYVADTGNGRILELDERGNFLRIIGQNVLKQPTGLYVDEHGYVYAADYGAGKVFVFDKNGKVVRTVEKPNSLMFGKNNAFKPKKIIIDKRNDLFIVGEGLIQGLVELSSEGDFMGYFGGNRAGFDLERSLQRIFFTKKQLSQLAKKLPPSPTNLAIDKDGLIYTATTGLQSNGIKKLNVAGDDLFHSTSFMSSNIADICIDSMGNIYAADSITGYIYEYDRDGNLLFVFGGTDSGNQRLGYFKSPSGIAVNSHGLLYVLDNERGNIQIFQPTQFTLLVHKALSLYLDGKYLESLGPWQKLLHYNSMFDLAHVGMGLAYYKQGHYDQAFQEFEFAKNKQEYSNTYWELRRIWMMKHISSIILILLGLITAWSIAKRMYRKFGFGSQLAGLVQRLARIRLVAQLLHMFRILRHPFDGYYELENGKASVLSATILLIMLLAIRLYAVFQTNFLFSSVDPLKVNVISEILKVLIPLFAWVISNYLVSIINDGEGKFKDVYKGSIYALSPYIIFSIPITLMSKGLTLLESVVYDYSHMFILLWCAFLMMVMVKEIHGYEIKETFKNIAITLSGMIVMVLISFIFFGLSNQVIDFVQSIIEEVKYRVS